MGKEKAADSNNLMVKIGVSLSWPFSLEQYQNGKASAWAETEVPSGMEKEGYAELRKLVQEEVAGHVQEIIDQKNNG